MLNITVDQQLMEQRLLAGVSVGNTSPGIDSQLAIEAVSCDAERKEIVISHLVKPWEVNIHGTMHGGMISTVLDDAMGILCGCYINPSFCSTVNLNVNFLRPVHLNERLYVRAELMRTGRNLIRTRATAWTTNPGAPCATTEATYYKTGTEMKSNPS